MISSENHCGTVVKKMVFHTFSQIARAESGALFFHQRSQIEGKLGFWVLFFWIFLKSRASSVRDAFFHILSGNGESPAFGSILLARPPEAPRNNVFFLGKRVFLESRANVFPSKRIFLNARKVKRFFTSMLCCSVEPVF